MLSDFEDIFGAHGPCLIKPQRFGDNRGWFSETYNAERLKALGFHHRFVQDNLSFSAQKNTLRGLHYQSPPRAQGKLVHALTGAVLDIAVDARQASPSFGHHIAVELTADSGDQLWVPPGFLHGFITLTDNTLIAYKVTDFYAPENDGVIAWNDPSLMIDWGTDSPILSDKDARAPQLDPDRPIFPVDWNA